MIFFKLIAYLIILIPLSAITFIIAILTIPIDFVIYLISFTTIKFEISKSFFKVSSDLLNSYAKDNW